MRFFAVFVLLLAAVLSVTHAAFPTFNDITQFPTKDEIFTMTKDALRKKIEGKWQISSGCALDVKTPESCKFNMQASPENCLSLKLLSTKLFGSKSSTMASLLNKKIYLASGSLDICQKIVTLKVVSEETLTIIPNFLVLTKASIEPTFKFQENALDLTFSGTFKLGTISYSVGVTKEGTDYTVTGKTTQSVTNLGALALSIPASVSGSSSAMQSAVKALHLDKIQLKDLQVDAKVTTDQKAVRLSVQLVSSTLGNPKLSLTVNRFKTGNVWNSTVVVGAVFGQISIANLIKAITTVDISKVPLLGKAQVNNLAILYSNNDLEEPVIEYSDETLKSMFPAVKGVKINFEAQIGKTGSPTKIETTIAKGNFAFKMTSDSGVSVSALIDQLVSGLSGKALPSQFSLQKVLDLRITEIDYNSESRNLKIPVSFPSKITIIPKAIELNNAKVIFDIQLGSGKVDASSGSGKGFGVEITSEWILGGSVSIQVSISKPAGENSFVISARPKVEIPVGAILQNFATSILPNGPLKNAVAKSGLSTFRIINPHLTVVLGSNVAARFGGTAAIGSWKGAHVEVVVGKINGMMTVALGVSLQAIPLTTVISTITGGAVNLGKMPGASILDNTDVGVIVASGDIPTTLTNLQFESPGLKGVDIGRGVTAAATLSFPPDCKGDKFCQLSKNLLGKDAKLLLKGRFDMTSLYLEAKVPTKINIVKGAAIQDVGLEVEVSPTKVAVGIGGTLIISNPALTFKGYIGVGTSGLEIRMSMQGMWRKPFGIPFLAVGDLMFEIGISPDPVAISKIALGGRAIFGLLDNTKAKPYLIDVKLYVGIDRNMPVNSYFYGSVSKLTIGTVLKAFGYFPSLPKCVEEIGFPRGINVSFTAKPGGVTLPIGLTIKQGFYLSGTIKILFFELSADIAVSTSGIFINIVAKPFNLGNGLIAIEGRSASMGPRIYVDVSWLPPKAFINIEGSVTILKILKRSINITIDHQGMKFRIEGSLGSFFEAFLEITCDYGSIQTANIRARGGFKQTLLAELRKKIKEGLDDLRQKAESGIASAKKKLTDANVHWDNAVAKLQQEQRNLESKKVHWDNAIRKLEDAKRVLESKKGDVDRAVASLEGKKRELESAKGKWDRAVEHLREKEAGCPRACKKRRSLNPFLSVQMAKGFLAGDADDEVDAAVIMSKRYASDAEQVAIAKVAALPRSRRAATFSLMRQRRWGWFKEKGREIKCGAIWLARKICIGALKALQWIVSKSKGLVDVAKAAVSAAQWIVDKGKIALDAAKLVLTGAQRLVDSSKGLVDIAKGLVKAAEVITDKSRVVLDVAKGALDAAKHTFKFGLWIVEKVSTAVLGGIIDLQEITFDVKLGLLTDSWFRVTIKASFFGASPITFGLDFTFNIGKVVMKVLNYIKEKIAAVFSKRELLEMDPASRPHEVTEDEYPAFVSIASREVDNPRNGDVSNATTPCAIMKDFKTLTDRVLAVNLPLIEKIQKLEALEEKYANGTLGENRFFTLNAIISIQQALKATLRLALRTSFGRIKAELGLSSDRTKEIMDKAAEEAKEECARESVKIMRQVFSKDGRNKQADVLIAAVLKLKKQAEGCKPRGC